MDPQGGAWTRRKLRDQRASLLESGADAADLELFEQYILLASVLGPPAAAAVQRKGLVDLDSLAKGTPKAFEKALSKTGLHGAEVSDAVRRFERWRDVVKAGGKPDSVTPLDVVLHRVGGVAPEDRDALRKKGIETVSDWWRERVEVGLSDETRNRVDAAVRLSVLDLSDGERRQLLRAGVKSSWDLVRMTERGREDLASDSGADRADVLRWTDRARLHLNDVLDRLDWRPSDVGLRLGGDPEDGPLIDPELDSCVECPDDVSVLSRFAYFIYLVRKTGQGLRALDLILHQGFVSLSPYDSSQPVPQVRIALDVLRSAFPGALTASHLRPVRLLRALRGLGLVPVRLVEVAERVASLLTTTTADSLVGRMRSALGDELASAPSFSVAEVGVLERESAAFRLGALVHHLEGTVAEVAGDAASDLAADAAELEAKLESASALGRGTSMPTFTDEELDALWDAASARADVRGRQRLVEPWDAIELEAAVLERDLLTERSGKTTRELFELLFIETDLGACERTTRVCVAIRSLQALLDAFRRAESDRVVVDGFRYLEYPAWRAERLGELYPEVRAWLRRDLLIGEHGPVDRGSYLRDQAVQRKRLRAELGRVSAAMGGARLISAPDPGLDPDGFDDLVRFSSTPYHESFEQGLRLIRTFLDADADVVEAHEMLDSDQPGLAVGRLQAAAAHLDGLLRTVFPDGSPWQVPAFECYRDLRKLHPLARSRAVDQLRVELEGGSKALFEYVATTSIEKLDLESGRFQSVDLSSTPWRPHGTFDLRRASDAAPVEIHKDAGSGTSRLRHLYYADDDFASNMTVRTTFRLPDLLREGHEVGIAARVRESGTGKVSSGYLLTLSWGVLPEEPAPSTGNEIVDGILAVGSAVGEFLFGDDDAPFSDLILFLILERLDSNGHRHELGRTQVALDARVDHLKFDSDTDYELHLETRGNSLRGSFVAPGETHTVEAADSVHEGGSFGICADEITQVHFEGIRVEVPAGTLAPPFQAKRRLNRPTIMIWHLVEHRYWLKATARELGGDLVLQSDSYSFVERGVQGPQPYEKYLVFDAGREWVDIESVDMLFEACLEGAFYLRHAAIPLLLSRAAYQRGDHDEAVGFLGLVYDDLPEGGHEIYPYLAVDPSDSDATGLDARLLKMHLAEILLARASWLFRKDTDDDRAEARELLRRVLALHGSSEDPCGCSGPVRELVEKLYLGLPLVLEGAIGIEVHGAVNSIRERLTDELVDRELLEGVTVPTGEAAESPGAYLESLRDLDRELSGRLAKRRQRLAKRNTMEKLVGRSQRLLERAELLAPVSEELEATSFLREVASGRSGDPARRSISSGISPSLLASRARGVDTRLLAGGTALIDGRIDVLHRALSFTLCVPHNPVVVSQLRRSCLLLDHLLNCRNVLGYPDSLIPPLRFETLHAIARQLADLAVSAEQQLFSLRSDAEAAELSMMEAEQALSLADATVKLEATKLEEARDGVLLAESQLRQTLENVNHVEELIETGLNESERLALNALGNALVFTYIAGLGSMVQGLLSGAGNAAASSNPGLALGSAGAGLVTNAASTVASMSQIAAQAHSMQASFERREEEWRHQLTLGRTGAVIGQIGVRQALARLDVASQQLGISEMQRQFATEGMHFLANRFLNTAMLVWMVQTIREEYRTRIGYAINAAFMAERALAFEIQEDQNVIRFDYYRPERDGLLGATELRTDLATLRTVKVASTERLLQKTKVVSLRAAMPIDFQRFKASGRLPFTTLLEWFDRESPGEYMRRIKSVRVTVLALVPPNVGIRASLINSGISTVVGSGPEFVADTIRRDPERIALSSGYQDSGVFQLDYSSDLLLPFEGSGVETQWVFEMLRSSNPIDYSTIADVVLTVDYTARFDSAYQRTVIERLGDVEIGERGFSMRYQFPDAWYHFHNRTSDSDPLVIAFDVEAADFPPNLSDPVATGLALLLSRREGMPAQELGVVVRFTPADGSAARVAPEVMTQGGLIQTRDPSGAAWQPIFLDSDRSPVGRWEIELPLSAHSRAAVDEDQLADVLFAVAFRGGR